MTTKLETVAKFHDLTQAQAARAALEGEGISTELLDEATGSIDWGLMPAMGGLRLQVGEADAPRALEILERLVPEYLDEDPSDSSTDRDDDLRYRQDSGRRKRRAGLVALLLLFFPPIIVVILLLVAWLAS